MSSRTNSILRYVRPQSVWLCPDCDAENELTENSCFLCGCGKTVSAVIIKPVNNFDYNETDTAEYKGVPDKYKVSKSDRTTLSSPGYGAKPGGSSSTGVISHGGLESYEYTIPEEKKRNPVATILIALIITVVLALFGIIIYSISAGYNISENEHYIDNQYVENYESTDINYYIEN